MKTAGIICEYNPFHNGHTRQFSLLRAAGYDRIVCLMSGNFVQRGEPAIAHRYLRAECALSAGADLVLELPFPYCSASAEYFARAAIRIFGHIGIDALSFGTESGDLEELLEAAEITASENFTERLREESAAHPEAGSAALYAQVYENLTGKPYPTEPNELLAVSYLRAMKQERAAFAPFPVKRDGNGYGNETLTEGVNPSASALRRVLPSCGIDGLHGFVPASTAEILERAIAERMAPVLPEEFGDLLLPSLRLADRKRTAALAELSGGMAERLLSAAKNSPDYRELLRSVSTKKYTDTRIRRAILFAVIGVTPNDLSAPPAYTRVLAANQNGCALLSALRKQDGGFLVTKPADAPTSPEALRQTELSDRADALYTLAMPQKRGGGYFTKCTPMIRK